MKLTRQQQKALHVGCELLADSLNQAGWDMKKTLKPGIEIPWRKMSVKEYLVKPVMKALLQHDSTTQLEKIGEIEELWDVIMRHITEKTGIDYIPFPHDPEKDKETLGGVRLSQTKHL